MKGQVPESLPFFYHPEFVCRKSDVGIITYCFRKTNHLVAFIHFQLNEKEAYSLHQSSFGGLAVVQEMGVTLLEDFLSYVIDDLKQTGVNKLTIRECPECYAIQSNKEQIYERLGFMNLFRETNQYIETALPFDKLVNRNRKRSLKSIQNLGYVFSQLQTNRLEEAHNLLVVNRKARGLELTMTLEQLQLAMEQFPDRYLLFGISSEYQLIAASVCIKVNQKILYDFYHGELPEYTESSPVTMLVAELYQYALSNNFEIIDLGISSVDGKLDEGLFQFKKSLGAKEESKNKYQLLL